MAFGFGPAVHGKVFGASGGLEITGMVALQATHHGHAEFACQERIFAEGLLSAPPAGITENVDVGSPEGEALILSVAAQGGGSVVLRARLVRNGRGDFPHERSVPGCAQADHLRKDRGAAVPADAVAGLAPPVVGRHSEPLDGGAVVHQLADLFRQREPGDQIVDARGQRLRGVAIHKRSGRHGWSGSAQSEKIRHAAGYLQMAGPSSIGNAANEWAIGTSQNHRFLAAGSESRCRTVKTSGPRGTKEGGSARLAPLRRQLAPEVFPPHGPASLE